MFFRSKNLFFLLACLPSLSMAASTLRMEVGPFNTHKVLVTLTVHKEATASPYYKLNDQLSVSGVNGNTCSKSGSSKSVYDDYFSKLYIVDDNSHCDISSKIAAASATISVESCTDETFKVCKFISKHTLKVKYKGDKITGIDPSQIDVTL